MKITVTHLTDLRRGDRITAVGAIDHSRKPLMVSDPLGPIDPGSPVVGVRCGTLAGGVEMVLYPSQCDGQRIAVER